MNVTRITTLAAGALLALAQTAQAGNTTAFAEHPLVLDQFGVICEIFPEGQRAAPDTVSGILNVVEQDQPIDVETVRVPAELGLSFGIRATLAPGTALTGIDVVVTHPPMGGAGQTVERWGATFNAGEVNLNLFTFEEEYELVQGPWLFQLISDGEVLLQQPFLVTARGSVPDVQQTCYGARIVS